MTKSKADSPTGNISRRVALKAIGLAATVPAAIAVSHGTASAQAGKYAPPSPNGPKLTLRVATNYAGASSMAKPIAEIFKKFQEDYPNIRIAHESTPGFDHQTKIKLDATSNRLPDVFSFWRLDPSYGLDQISDAGLIGNLTEWRRNDPFFKDLFDESSWSTCSGTIFWIARGWSFRA